jgi:parallel beta-helix repeat protein
VVLDNFYGSVISGNMIEQSKGVGVVLDHGCNGVTVSSNIIINNECGGVDLRSARSCTVSGNTIASNQPVGCRIASKAAHLTVVGNNFSGRLITPDGYERAADGGIVIEEPRNVLITGNTFVQPDQAANVTNNFDRAVTISDNLAVDLTETGAP